MTLEERIEAYKKRKAKEYATDEQLVIPFTTIKYNSYLAGFEAGRKIGRLEQAIKEAYIDARFTYAEAGIEELLRDGE